MQKQKRRGRQGFTLIEILVVVFIIGVLLGIALPNFLQSRETSRAKSCISNLRQIQSAKERWAMDNNRPATDTPTTDDLLPNYLNTLPTCDAGGIYTLGSVNDAPACSVGGAHDID